MSLHWLRRSRLLAALFLTASPGAVGAWLPLLHPCPVDSPWLLHAVSSGHQHHGVPAADTPSDSDHSCHCVGSCVSTAAPASPAAKLAERIEAPIETPGWNVHDASLVIAAPVTLLPPATAPPLH